MHETKLMQHLIAEIDRIAQSSGVQRVASARFRIGPLSHFTEQHFIEHFIEAARGHYAEGARLECVMGEDITHHEATEVILESLSFGDDSCQSNH